MYSYYIPYGIPFSGLLETDVRDKIYEISIANSGMVVLYFKV